MLCTVREGLELTRGGDGRFSLGYGSWIKKPFLGLTLKNPVHLQFTIYV